MNRITAQRCAASAALMIAAAASGQSCDLVPNGSFDGGFAGWSVAPDTREVGEAAAETGHLIVDGTSSVVPFDDKAAQLSVFASAEGTEPKSSAAAQIVLARQAVLADRYLRVRAFGYWEGIYTAAGQQGYELAAVVRGPGGAEVSTTIHAWSLDGLLECPSGVQLLGVTGLEPEHFLDVTGGGATGIDVGDAVEIEIVLSAEAFAPDACDHGEMMATILIDEIAFCDRPPCPADLDGNASVGIGDLLALLGAWGDSPGDPADLDLDSFVGITDLLILLGSWGSCPG